VKKKSLDGPAQESLILTSDMLGIDRAGNRKHGGSKAHRSTAMMVSTV
jgi:hypothetical protein